MGGITTEKEHIVRHIITSALVALGLVVWGAGAAGATEDTTQADTVCVPSDAIEAIAPTYELQYEYAVAETYVQEYRWIPVHEYSGEQVPGTTGQWTTNPAGPVDEHPRDAYVWKITTDQRDSDDVLMETFTVWAALADAPEGGVQTGDERIVTTDGSPFVPAVTCVAGPAGEQGPTGPAGPVGYVSAPAAAAIAAAPAFAG